MKPMKRRICCREPKPTLMEWSALTPDLLVEIAIRIPSMEDFMAFRGVCTCWRAAATKDKFISSRPRVPLLLPEMKGKRSIEVGFGWLLTLTDTGVVTLLNPFSRQQIHLPNFETFPDYKKFRVNPLHYFILQAALSQNPSKTSNFTLMVVQRGGDYLGFWRSGDEGWTHIEQGRYTFFHVNTYKGKFYATSPGGELWVWDDNPTAQPRVLYYPESFVHILSRQTYLVESPSGKLLLIHRVEDDRRLGGASLLGLLGDTSLDDDTSLDERCDKYYKYLGTTAFKVYQLELDTGSCVEISNLEGDAIFVGFNAAIYVSKGEVERSKINGDCIYFTDDFFESFAGLGGGGVDTGIYDVKKKSVEYIRGGLSSICPPVWISLGN